MKDGNRHPPLYAEIAKLTKAVSAHKPFRIFTFGVFDGLRVGLMGQKAREAGRPNVELYGVDMFEDMTPEKNSDEIGKSTLAPSFEQARQNVGRYGIPRVLKFYKGDSVKVLPKIRHELPPMDLVFVDGGHSLVTIASDAKWAFNMCAKHGTVVFDDVYPGDESKGAWRLCNTLSGLSAITKTLIRIDLTPEDVTPSLKIRMALVTAAHVHAASKLASFGFHYGMGTDGLKEPSLKPVELLTPEKMVRALNDAGIKAELGPVIQDSAVIEVATKNTEKLAEVVASLMQTDTLVYDEEANLTPEQMDQIINFRKGPDDGTGSADRGADVRPVAVRAEDGGDGDPKHAEQSGDGGGRREPGLEPGAAHTGVVEGGDPGSAGDAPLPEERAEPDPVVEPGAVQGDSVGDPVRGDGEQRPEVPKDVVAPAPPSAPQMRPGPRRSNDKRPRS